MGPGEGGDDLGQRAEVEVQQAADGMMVEEPVTLGGELRRSRRGIRTARGPGSAAIGRSCSRGRACPAGPASSRAQPARDRGRRRRVGDELGVERQDARAAVPRPSIDHAAPQVGGPAPLRVDPPPEADVLAQGGDHAQVRGQLLGVMVREARSRSSPGRRRRAGPRRAAARTRRGRHPAPPATRSCRGNSRRTPRPGHRPRGTVAGRGRSQDMPRIGDPGTGGGGQLVERRQVGMLEESAGQGLDQVFGQSPVGEAAAPARRGARASPRSRRRPAARWPAGSAAGAAARARGRRPRPAGRRRPPRGSSAGGTFRVAPAAGDHRDDRQVERLGDRTQVAGMLARCRTAGRRSGSPSVPSTTDSSAEAAARANSRRQTARRHQPRRRGDGPAGRSPGRPPPWPSGRPGCGNAGLASAAESARPASPATPPRAPGPSRWSPGPVAGAGRLRLADLQDGARWNSSGPNRTYLAGRAAPWLGSLRRMPA